MQRLHHEVAATAERMPAHADFLDTYCRADRATVSA
jgi:hypothetical protein